MKRSKGYILTIDGPSGAGKSTVSRRLAKSLKGKLLDTGAMYRSVAYYAIKEDAKTPTEYGKIARRLKFSTTKNGSNLLVNRKQLGKKLRTEKVSAMASHVSQFKNVRKILTAKQRALGKQWSKKVPVVVEGRDIGTVVFPKVPHKFFVTANAKERARRRHSQLKEMGQRRESLTTILRKQTKRDKRDASRKIAPLKKARGAVVVNTSSKGISDVVAYIRDCLDDPR